MKEIAPYSVPKEPGRWRAMLLALVVHVALFVFLWVGVRWQNETPTGIEAEVWSPQNQEAAPRPEPRPAIEKQPETRPEPKPEPKPEPVVKETPKPPVVEPVRKNPDIALEQEKKRKAQEKLEREENDRQAKLKQQKLEQAQEEKREKLKQAEKDRLEKQKEKEKADALAKKEADAKKQAAEKAAADKKRKQDAQDARDAKTADQQRNDDLKRLSAQAGTGGSGSAAQTQGSRADAGYGDKIRAKIKSNTIFNVPEGLAGNPATEFEVELLPDGSIRGLSKVKSSGVPGFDEAVQRAISKSAPFPPDKSGKVPSSFRVIHKPKDQ